MWRKAWKSSFEAELKIRLRSLKPESESMSPTLRALHLYTLGHVSTNYCRRRHVADTHHGTYLARVTSSWRTPTRAMSWWYGGVYIELKSRVRIISPPDSYRAFDVSLLPSSHSASFLHFIVSTLLFYTRMRILGPTFNFLIFDHYNAIRNS